MSTQKQQWLYCPSVIFFVSYECLFLFVCMPHLYFFALTFSKTYSYLFARYIFFAFLDIWSQLVSCGHVLCLVHLYLHVLLMLLLLIWCRTLMQIRCFLPNLYSWCNILLAVFNTNLFSWFWESVEVWVVRLLLRLAMFAQDFSFETVQISSCKQHSGFFIVQHSPIA